MAPKIARPLLNADVTGSANACVLTRTDETVQIMKKHKILKQCWSDSEPLEFHLGGQLQPFDPTAFAQAMAARPGAECHDYTYECLTCMSSFNYLATSTPGVRISASQVERAIAQDFPLLDGKSTFPTRLSYKRLY